MVGAEGEGCEGKVDQKIKILIRDIKPIFLGKN